MTAGYELDGDVAIVTLDRPDRYNAIDAAMCAAVVESLGRAGREARAVVLTGAGKAFCSGADLSDLQDEYESGTPDLSARLDDVFHPVVHAIAGCAVPKKPSNEDCVPPWPRTVRVSPRRSSTAPSSPTCPPMPW